MENQAIKKFEGSLKKEGNETNEKELIRKEGNEIFEKNSFFSWYFF